MVWVFKPLPGRTYSYETLFSQKPRVPRVNMSPEVPGERLSNMVKARAIISKGQEARKDKYKTLPRATELKVGDLVSLKVLHLESSIGVGSRIHHPAHPLKWSTPDSRIRCSCQGKLWPCQVDPCPSVVWRSGPVHKSKSCLCRNFQMRQNRLYPPRYGSAAYCGAAEVTQRYTSQGRDWEDCVTQSSVLWPKIALTLFLL